jgi:hypothetical protein
LYNGHETRAVNLRTTTRSRSGFLLYLCRVAGVSRYHETFVDLLTDTNRPWNLYPVSDYNQPGGQCFFRSEGLGLAGCSEWDKRLQVLRASVWDLVHRLLHKLHVPQFRS